jgi:C4-dicarboxylate-specific signal transduction histidine kinase
VALLENERDEDRVSGDRESPWRTFFESLSAEELVAEVMTLAEEGADAADALPLLRAFGSRLDQARKTIQQRFVFYSRMATVGTIAQMLIHEIRNRTIAFGSFLQFVNNRLGPIKDKDLGAEYRSATAAVTALERLADTFAPLASRAFRRRQRYSVVEERIRECLALQSAEIVRKGVSCHVPGSQTAVAVDPGELDAILLNLITNSLFWLNQSRRVVRKLSSGWDS